MSTQNQSKISNTFIFAARNTLTLLVLVICGCCDNDSIPKNINKLQSGYASVRNEAALSLARCGAKASAAVPTLSRLIYDDNVGVQSSAAYALRKIDTKEARAVLARAEEKRARARK